MLHAKNDDLCFVTVRSEEMTVNDGQWLPTVQKDEMKHIKSIELKKVPQVLDRSSELGKCRDISH